MQMSLGLCWASAGGSRAPSRHHLVGTDMGWANLWESPCLGAAGSRGPPGSAENLSSLSRLPHGFVMLSFLTLRSIRRGSPRKPGGDGGRKPHCDGPRSAPLPELERCLPHHQRGPLRPLQRPHGPRHQRGHGHRGEGGCSPRLLLGSPSSAPATCPEADVTGVIFGFSACHPSVQGQRTVPDLPGAEAASAGPVT